MQRWTVAADEAGSRIDRHVAERLAEPRNQVQQWLRDGRVLLNGATVRPSAIIAAGDAIACDPPPLPAADERVEPEAGALEILAEEASFVVLDKPAELTVHPGAGRPAGTLANRLLHRYPELAGIGGPGRPGIVHRLDHGTSGVLVVARTPAAYRALSRAFSERRVGKRYLAIAYGAPAAAGEVDAPIGRHPSRRKEMTMRPDGRPAKTLYRPLARAGAASLLEVEIESGRTHQIRVHLKHAGYPIVGDPVYGEARWKTAPPAARSALRDFARPALHAWRLRFPHPESGHDVAFTAPPPGDFIELWERIGGGPIDEALG